jgi:DNA-binding protein HU-beta/integration host factor subunit beta
MPVSKKEIVAEIASRVGLTQVDVGIIIEELMAAISRALEQGRNIEIRGFGQFKVKRRKAHVARNPRTGEKVEIKEGMKPVFAASRELKGKVNA